MRKFKPRRAKCTECGNGMIKKSNNGKYCASCKKAVSARLAYEWFIRTGKNKNPGVGTSRFMIRGKNNHHWVGGSHTWQVKMFRGTKCERCDDGGQMHLHHRDRDRSNWKKSNLETLCVPCHKEEHRDDGGVMYAAA